jgi:hypothetical protein
MGLLSYLFGYVPPDPQDNPVAEETDDPEEYGYGDLVDSIHDNVEKAPSEDVDIASDTDVDADADPDGDSDADGDGGDF